MFCTCYFVALMTCFPIGLMSLSLVRRAASDFKLVSFHSSSCSIFTASQVGYLDLNCYILSCFPMRMYQKSAQNEGNLQQETNNTAYFVSCLYVSR